MHRLFPTTLLAALAAVFWATREPKPAAPPQRMAGYEVHGIDVSHYQERVNWDSVAASGIRFAFVKATEGELWQDSFFCQNWEKMRRSGLRRGAYHFFNPSLGTRAQAENFLNLVELRPGDLPPVLDVEDREGVSPGLLVAKLRVWLWTVEERTGVRPILYTNQNFYQKWLAGHFDRYPLWIARFSDEKPELAEGCDWLFWQYANDGRLAGVSGPVDFNVFRGSAAALDRLCIPEPEPVAVEMPVAAAGIALPILSKKNPAQPAP